MNNPFVTEAVRMFQAAGISTLRFNFSNGRDGIGDDTDALISANQLELSSAVAMLKLRAPDAAVILVGYSYGALVSLAAARKDPTSIQALALIAPPIEYVSEGLGPSRRDFALWPMLMAAGDADEYCSTARLRTTAGDSASTIVILKSIGHFLQGASAELAARHAVEWVEALQV